MHLLFLSTGMYGCNLSSVAWRSMIYHIKEKETHRYIPAWWSAGFSVHTILAVWMAPTKILTCNQIMVFAVTTLHYKWWGWMLTIYHHGNSYSSNANHMNPTLVAVTVTSTQKKMTTTIKIERPTSLIKQNKFQRQAFWNAYKTNKQSTPGNLSQLCQAPIPRQSSQRFCVQTTSQNRAAVSS